MWNGDQKKDHAWWFRFWWLNPPIETYIIYIHTHTHIYIYYIYILYIYIYILYNYIYVCVCACFYITASFFRPSSDLVTSCFSFCGIFTCWYMLPLGILCATICTAYRYLEFLSACALEAKQRNSVQRPPWPKLEDEGGSPEKKVLSSWRNQVMQSYSFYWRLNILNHSRNEEIR